VEIALGVFGVADFAVDRGGVGLVAGILVGVVEVVDVVLEGLRRVEGVEDPLVRELVDEVEEVRTGEGGGRREADFGDAFTGLLTTGDLIDIFEMS